MVTSVFASPRQVRSSWIAPFFSRIAQRWVSVSTGLPAFVQQVVHRLPADLVVACSTVADTRAELRARLWK